MTNETKTASLHVEDLEDVLIGVLDIESYNNKTSIQLQLLARDIKRKINDACGAEDIDPRYPDVPDDDDDIDDE